MGATSATEEFSNLVRRLELTNEEKENYKKYRNWVKTLIPKTVKEAEKFYDKIQVTPTKESCEVKLTETEQKVLKLLLLGYNYNEVADNLSVSFTTIRTHVNNLFAKRSVNTLSELIVLELTGQLKGIKYSEKKTIKPTLKNKNQQKALAILNNLLK